MPYPFPPLGNDALPSPDFGQPAPQSMAPSPTDSSMENGMGDQSLNQNNSQGEPQDGNEDDPQDGSQQNIPSPYEKGGRVAKRYPKNKKWHYFAEQIRKKGEEGDSVLAHISPREAAFLATHFGGDINRKTGLPQFGLLDKAWDFFAKKVVGPVGGAILGNTLLPGVGGFLGGGLGGMFGHPNDRAGPLGGALAGQAGLAGLNALGTGANVLGMSGLGSNLQGLGGQNYLSSLMSNISPQAASFMGPQASLPSFLTGWGNAAASSAKTGAQGGSPLEQILLANAQNGANNATASSVLIAKLISDPTALLSLATLGSNWHFKNQDLKEVKEQVKRQEREKKEEAKRRKEQEDDFYNRMKFEVNEEFLPQYDEGGEVSDAHVVTLRNGDYVIPADVVSALGDWNPKAGALQLDGLVKKLEHHKGNGKEFHQNNPNLGIFLDGWTKGKSDKVPAIIKADASEGVPLSSSMPNTRARLSDGEYVFSRDVVTKLGKGNNALGAKHLDMFLKNVREHKGLPERTPPAKNPLTYMMMGEGHA